MKRRTLMQRMAALIGSFFPLRYAASQAVAQTGSFPGPHMAVLHDIGLLVLPSALGKAGTAKVVQEFGRYVREYRPGADTDHGYGFTHVVPKPPSPEPVYLAQLAAMPSPLTRAAVEQSLSASSVKELPRIPQGKNVIADLMSFYFRSSEANDLCYERAIRRDECRGLAGSEQIPAPLRKSA